jgi:hypothetical protein
MNIVLKRDIPNQLNFKIKDSPLAPIIGSCFILPWGLATFTYIRTELPFAIFIVNAVLWPLFFILLIKQIKQVFNPKKFVIAGTRSDLYFQLNHGIKNIPHNEDYVLKINLGSDLKKIENIKECLFIKDRHTKTRNTYIQYFNFQLTNPVTQDIFNTHKKIYLSSGVTGSPIALLDKSVLLNLTERRIVQKKLKKHLSKLGLNIEEHNQIENNLIFNKSDDIENYYRKLLPFQGKIRANQFLNYFDKEGLISRAQIDAFKRKYTK